MHADPLFLDSACFMVVFIFKAYFFIIVHHYNPAGGN